MAMEQLPKEGLIWGGQNINQCIEAVPFIITAALVQEILSSNHWKIRGSGR